MQKQQKGSFLVTLIIIAIFMFAGVFYIKTSQPALYETAVAFVKEKVTKAKTLSQVNAEVYDAVTTPKGEILSSAEDIQFNYLSTRSITSTHFPLDSATVTSRYGTRTDPVTKKALSTHHGIDLAAPEGSEIYCYKSGVVKTVKTDKIFGNCVLVNHGDFESFYAHMSKVYVSAGQSVSAGQKLGVIGSTGKSTGTHLHFEIIKDGVRTDPSEYLYEKL